ncbi:unnamed protein product, partial [Symbiodinium pilosum]
ALNVPPWELRLTADGSFLDPVGDAESTLEALGLKEDSEVMVLRSSPRVLTNPGVSAYSAEYCCTVLQVRQAGWKTIEIDFSVRGDGSLGRLQRPSFSKLSWKGSKRILTRKGTVKLTVDNAEDGGPSHKQGTLTFEDVPTCGQVAFEYGESGYDKLILDLFGEG